MSHNKTQKKNAATQTSDTNTMLEIARLQEQVRLLTIETEHLRKYAIEEPPSSFKPTTPTSPNNVDKTPKHVRSLRKKLPTPTTNEKNKMSMRGCACKGTCTSKICGCVKKDISCGESCKCNNVTCKNQVHKNMDQNKENLENIGHLVNATVCKSIFSPDVIKDDIHLDVEQLRASSLYFGSPKQLTFALDKEEEKEKKETTVKVVNTKGSKNSKESKERNKKVQKSLPATRSKSFKLDSTKQVENIKSTSSKEEEGQNSKKTEKHVMEKYNETDTKINEKIKEIDKRTNNYMKNIANGMVSLRHGQKGSKQVSVNKPKINNIISDSDSNDDNPIAEKKFPQGGINNSSQSFQQKETFDVNQTPTKNENSDDVINPMKPKRELSRTPIHGSSVSRDISDASMSLCGTLIEEGRQIHEEFSQAEVDWEEYQSQLVPCAKCKRKFHPLRIKKHESCCKGGRTSIKCFDRV